MFKQSLKVVFLVGLVLVLIVILATSSIESEDPANKLYPLLYTREDVTLDDLYSEATGSQFRGAERI